jgi:hypothetical protein
LNFDTKTVEVHKNSEIAEFSFIVYEDSLIHIKIEGEPAYRSGRPAYRSGRKDIHGSVIHDKTTTDLIRSLLRPID